MKLDASGRQLDEEFLPWQLPKLYIVLLFIQAVLCYIIFLQCVGDKITIYYDWR